MYEVRTHNNPDTMPLGESVVSRHGSIEAAFKAIEAEDRRLQRVPEWKGGNLRRVVVDTRTHRTVGSWDGLWH